MTGGDRPGWGYYLALLLFLGILAFAVLGLVRSSSGARTVAGRPAVPSTTPTPSGISLATGPVPTPEIPPPTPSVPTEPPSRTYLHPPPELAVTAAPVPEVQPRR
ncbi:MAG TPA: hypothetical protein VFW15_07345 [Thermoanaerobaculia bacterium]|nr:hypothetical protein [Thermoanaerobaculia bacterium]